MTAGEKELFHSLCKGDSTLCEGDSTLCEGEGAVTLRVTSLCVGDITLRE